MIARMTILLGRPLQYLLSGFIFVIRDDSWHLVEYLMVAGRHSTGPVVPLFEN